MCNMQDNKGDFIVNETSVKSVHNHDNDRSCVGPKRLVHWTLVQAVRVGALLGSLLLCPLLRCFTLTGHLSTWVYKWYQQSNARGQEGVGTQ